jgi:hypothetical protein
MEVAMYEDNMTFKSVYFASHTTKKRDYFKQIENSDRDQKYKRIVERRGRYFRETKQLQENL